MSDIIKVDVGTPPSSFNECGGSWTMAEVRFHNFANLASRTTRGEHITSPNFTCFAGHEFCLKLYPRGESPTEVGGNDGSKHGYVGLRLQQISNGEPIKIQYGFSVRGESGKEKVNTVYDTSYLNIHRSYPDLGKLSKLKDSLINMALVVEVRMRLPISSSKTTTRTKVNQFIPTNPLNTIILSKFMNEESADVVFEIDSENDETGGRSSRKRSKTTVKLYAHRFIIVGDTTSLLADICKPSGEGRDITTVSITDVKPEVFKHVVFYLYGGKLSNDELKNNAKDIINACDKYGIAISLKLEAEACYVNTTTLSIDNVLENLLFADSKNLAALKEAVMDYIVENGESIIGKVSFDDVSGSTVTDVLTAMSRSKNKKDNGTSDDDGTDYNKMRVATLRKMLHDKGLNVDGSREALVALLQQNS